MAAMSTAVTLPSGAQQSCMLTRPEHACGVSRDMNPRCEIQTQVMLDTPVPGPHETTGWSSCCHSENKLKPIAFTETFAASWVGSQRALQRQVSHLGSRLRACVETILAASLHLLLRDSIRQIGQLVS